MTRAEFEYYITAFEDQLLLLNKSNRTITEYAYDLRIFMDFLDSKKILEKVSSPAEINRHHVQGYMIYLRKERKTPQNRNLAPASVNRKMCVLRSFFDFLIKEEYMTGENPAKTLDLVKETALSTHTYLTPEEAKRLLDALRGSSYYPRDILIFNFMLRLGLRISEVVGINLRDINLATKELVVHGKGNKERTLPLTGLLCNLLKDYMIFRATHLPSEGQDALFISRNGRRITTRRVQYIMEKYCKKAGLNVGREQGPARRRITCHKLRHTFATLRVQNGVDIATLKEVLGHESINTTQIYARASNQQVREAIEKDPID